MKEKYIVKTYFEDLQDNNHPYKEGDTFPREGFDVSIDRIRELASPFNKRGIELIEKVRKSEKTEKTTDSEE